MICLKKTSVKAIALFLAALMIVSVLPVNIAFASVEIPDLLEGDKAFISALSFTEDKTTESGYSINTGTGPWDEDDEPGNDSCATNNIVRTYDSVTYETYFMTDLHNATVEEGIAGYKEGTVYFEYIIPTSSDKAIFDTEAMGWLFANKQITFEVAESELDGKACQILRGSYLLSPNDSNPSAIGASYNTANIVIRILNMPDGDMFQPIFTMWLAGNPVKTTYKNQSSQSGGIPESIVYNSEYNCDEHRYNGKCDCVYKSIAAPPVTVSAAPNYNVQLRKSTHNNNILLGSFDFSTGNEKAANKDAGIVNGRMHGFGITLQLKSQIPDKGIRGVEMPDGSDITFDLKLKTTLTKPNGTVVDSNVIDEDFRALFWSGDENMPGEFNSDGRKNCTASTQILDVAPYNRDTDGKYEIEKDYSRCKNGGTWSFVVDEKDPSIIHVTVSGYEADMKALPYCNVNQSSSSNVYYNPKEAGRQFWNVKTACISAGKVWVVQPYYDSEGLHLRDYYGSGTCNTSLEDINLVMTGTSGRSTDEFGQAVTTDDFAAVEAVYSRPGNEGTTIRYTNKTASAPLTVGCNNTNADWAISGQDIGLSVATSSNGAEGTKTAVAISNMIKFDDAFFEPKSTSGGSLTKPGVIPPFKTTIRRVFWGAKPDKTGWDHKGLLPDEDGYDYDMLAHTSDDLIWFESLDELKEQGYVPVACYFEQLGLNSDINGISNTLYGNVLGTIKPGCKENYAYLLTCEAYIWNKEDVADYAAAYYDTTISNLTNEQYDSYVKSEEFYTRGSNKRLDSFDAQPHYCFNSKQNSNFFKSIKAVYVDGIYTKGSNAPGYIDSCYVIPFKAKITKSVAQTNNDAEKTIKKVYDVGQNQRVVDYVLNPSISLVPGAGDSNLDIVKTTVEIRDTLPAGLSYIIGSAVYDRQGDKTYIQDDTWQKKGTVEGAENFAPTVINNSDGTTDLIWIMKDVEIDPNVANIDLGLIYFSASIGTPLDESTDVDNQQQLENVVRIHTEKDVNCEYRRENENYAVAAIEVLKQTGVSIVKQADCDTIDKGQPIGYTMHIGNNSGTTISNAIIVDHFPYSGDSRGSHFSGDVYVTKFAAVTDDKDFYNSFDYYYTTNTAFRDKSSMDYINENYTSEDFEKNPDWIRLNVSAGNQKDSLFTNLPSASEQKGDKQIVSIVAVGDLHANETLKLRVEISAPGTQAKDKLVNTLTRGPLVSESIVQVVSRTISGYVWLDENSNGKYDGEEDKMDEITVTLYVKDENGEYVPYKYTDVYGNVIDGVITTGSRIDMTSGKVEKNEDSDYAFDNLPEGTYRVVFNGEQSISDIEMPSANSLKGSENFEAECILPIEKTSITMTKAWDDEDNLDKLRGEYGVTLYADGEPASEEVILGADELTYTWTGLPISKNGKVINYTVVETTVPKGYTPIYDGLNIVNKHEPVKEYLPVVFFAPDNISFYLAAGITYYESPDGERKHVSTGGFIDGFHDSTTIYVERGTVIKFTNKTYFTSYEGDYLTAIKSGENAASALPMVVEADDEGYFTFRVTDKYYFITMVQSVENPDTGEKQPWYQFILDLIQKIKDFFANLFG